MERLQRLLGRIFPQLSQLSESSSSIDKSETNSKEEEESSSEPEKNNIDNDIIYKNSEDLFKCYICLNKSFDPVICRFCGNIACKKCFKKWLTNKSQKCGCCRKKLTKNDLISLPIIKKLNNYINKFQEESNDEICQIHQEKILFYCMKCLKKYCGRCLFFRSEEAKIHQGHNIVDYSLLKKSEYNDIINKIEKFKDSYDEIKEEIIKNENYKEEIKNIFDNSKMAVKYFQYEIENKLKQKINEVSYNSEELKEANNDLEKKNNEISSILRKVEKIDKKIKNFNINKGKGELELILNKINLLENNSISLRNEEIKIKFDFRLKYFHIMKNYNELINTKDKNLDIYEPLLIIMKLEEVKGKEEQSILKIIIQHKNKNALFEFFSLKLNNKIYYFDLKDKKDNSNNNIQINILGKFKCEGENKVYITSIPKNELSKTENLFYFSNYIFSMD